MLSRRRFLAAVAALTATVTLWPARVFAFVSNGLAGTIQQFGVPGTLDLVTPTGIKRVWFLAAGASPVASTYNRDGAASLSDFVVGDEVAVELLPARATHIGKRMELLYRVTYGWITEITTTHISTSGGRARLSSTTVVHDADNYYEQLAIGDLAIGHRVAITTRFDPATAEPLARNIAVFADY